MSVIGASAGKVREKGDDAEADAASIERLEL